MYGEIIAIGDELVTGRVLNTTSGFAASKLFSAGFQISRITSIGDDPDIIDHCLHAAIARSDYVIITGGLGPTSDDITNEVVAKSLGRKLVLHKSILEKIRRLESQWNLDPNPLREKLAWLPDGAKLLNPDGHAAGYLLEHDGTPLFFLPGIPEQLEDMMVAQVLPRLDKYITRRLAVRQRTFRIFGKSETEINLLVEKLEFTRDGLSIGYYPDGPEVNVTVTVKGLDLEEVKYNFDKTCNTVEKLMERSIVAVDPETLEAVTGRLLLEAGCTLAVAESCTGGLMAHRITSVPGSSQWFDRGVVTYSNISKEELLGVSHDTLTSYGAVSSQTAIEMALGVRRVAGTSFGLAITGIAGPAGGSREKPVGTVYISMVTPEKAVCERFMFPGTRHMIQALASETALDWLRRYLRYGSYIPGYRPTG
ncbi:MAG TPA: CinA family nicotinamide mononucleotide deamidase-related protein [Thermodesulfobacteriaceae bacterium]|nr:CinA family nicotinamide mononucleotide deamidase-related protein [Thermodesulfobacteriaceae bacterium]